MLDCTVTAVSDESTPNAVGISCYSTYSHAILLALADPCSMSVRQIELADRWLGQWARKVFPYAQQRETEGPVIVVDLDGAQPGTLVASVPAHAPDSMRFGYPGKLATSVRGRLKRLAGGATPAELALGHDPSVEQCVALLSHLDARWYQAQKRDDATHAGHRRVRRRRSGRVLPRRGPHVRPPGPARPPVVRELAAPRDARRADRLRPPPRRRRAALAVGAPRGPLRLARGAPLAQRADAAPVVPRPAHRRSRRGAHAPRHRVARVDRGRRASSTCR
jgi:hypothetical protein